MRAEFYDNDGHIDLKRLKEQFAKKEIYWETMAAIGAATGSGELIEYAQNHKGGRLNMCTALENLKQEGRQEGRKEGRQEGRQEGRKEGRQEGLEEGILKGMITAYRELNLPEDAILLKLQQKLNLSCEKAQEYLNKTKL